MTALTDCAVFLSQAMVIAGEAFGMSKKALVRTGYDKTTAHTIHKLAGIYYGRCGAPRKQERSREKATDAGCSFASLKAIERFVAKLPKSMRGPSARPWFPMDGTSPRLTPKARV